MDSETAPPSPIKRVETGYKDRVEYIYTRISEERLDTGTRPNSTAQRFTQEMSPHKENDAGQLIAKRLGGTGRETHNIVPLNRHVNRGVMRTHVEDRIYGAVKEGNTVDVAIMPQYRGPRTKRPSSLKYVIAVPNNGSVTTGDIPNPTPSQMKSRPRK